MKNYKIEGIKKYETNRKYIAMCIKSFININKYLFSESGDEIKFTNHVIKFISNYNDKTDEDEVIEFSFKIIYNLCEEIIKLIDSFDEISIISYEEYKTLLLKCN